MQLLDGILEQEEVFFFYIEHSICVVQNVDFSAALETIEHVLNSVPSKYQDEVPSHLVECLSNNE